MIADSPRRGRVLVVVQNLPVPFDRRVWLECQSLVAAGYEVSVICPKGPGDPAYQLLDGVHLYKYPAPPRVTNTAGYALEFAWCWSLTAMLSLRVLRRHGFDVMQACNPPDIYWALALPYKLIGKRFVYDQHDLCPELYESRFGQNAKRGLTKALVLLERATYRVADHVISTNSSYKGIAMRRGGRTDDAVTIVRSGPDTTQMKPGERIPELARGHEYLACYLGVMGPQDGIDVLLQAWAVLVHELGRDDCHLALLGFGDCFDDLVRLSIELGIEEHVTFTGRADAPLISRYLTSADIGVCPDPHSPLNDMSTMNKVMEYMAFGLPLVSFDLPESLVSAGDAGVFVKGDDATDFARAVSGLLDDRVERRRLRARARARAVSMLDWRAQAPNYIKVFDRLSGIADRRLVFFPNTNSPGRFLAIAERRKDARALAS